MAQLSPTLFGVIVIALVGLMVVVPRLRNRSHKPTQHEMYFNDQPAARPTVRTSGEMPLGAPRAPSPTRQPAGAPQSAEQPAPLKLPL